MSTTQEKTGKKRKRGPRPFDFSRFYQRHIALRVAYDGRRFGGLATQGGGEGDNSIERHLFDALQKAKLVASREGACFSRSGRTDKGVSAFGQVVALRARSAFEPDVDPESLPWHPADEAAAATEERAEALDIQLAMQVSDGGGKEGGGRQADAAGEATKRRRPDGVAGDERGKRPCASRELDYAVILNRILPEEIRVVAWAPVTDGFNARFSSSSRTYRYYFPSRGHDVDAMNRACGDLLGTHDFRNFCKMDVSNVSNFQRTIHAASVRRLAGGGGGDGGEEDSGIGVFEVIGNAFLWHMVRCIMAVLSSVGRGAEDASVVRELLDTDAHPGKPPYELASDVGLVLYDCGYGDRLRFSHTPESLGALYAHLRKRWERHAVEAAKALDQMRSLRERTMRVRDLRRTLEAAAARAGGADASALLRDIEARALPASEAPEVPLAGVLHALEGSGFELNDLGHFALRNAKAAKRYTPLLQRKPHPTYEEKLGMMGGRKRKLYEEHAEMWEAGKLAADEDAPDASVRPRSNDQAFFATMLRQGGVREERAGTLRNDAPGSSAGSGW